MKLKKIIKSKYGRRTIFFLLEHYVRMLKKTNRYVTEGEELLAEFRESKKPVILALWHETLLVPLCYLGNRDIHVLISSHRSNAYYMHGVVHRFGWPMIKAGNGDGNRELSNAKALVSMIKTVREGKDVVITPDGTSGPVRRIKPGLLYLAQKTGAPIIPFGVAARPCKNLPTWDRFVVPLPFSRAALAFGQPFYVESKLSKEAFQQKTEELEGILNALQDHAEEMLK